jgi:hypothetical protein
MKKKSLPAPSDCDNELCNIPFWTRGQWYTSLGERKSSLRGFFRDRTKNHRKLLAANVNGLDNDVDSLCNMTNLFVDSQRALLT